MQKGCFLLIGIFIVVSNCRHQKDILQLDLQLNHTACKQIIAQIPPSADRIHISTSPSWKAWDSLLFNVFSNALKAYVAPYPLNPQATQDKGYTLFIRDQKNESFLFNESPREFEFAMVLFLNDDIGGGEWSFPEQQMRIEPRCGKLVIYPVCFTHPHKIEKIRIGKEFFIMTWFF
jgi:hypothetical protein